MKIFFVSITLLLALLPTYALASLPGEPCGGSDKVQQFCKAGTYEFDLGRQYSFIQFYESNSSKHSDEKDVCISLLEDWNTEFYSINCEEILREEFNDYLASIKNSDSKVDYFNDYLIPVLLSICLIIFCVGVVQLFNIKWRSAGKRKLFISTVVFVVIIVIWGIIDQISKF